MKRHNTLAWSIALLATVALIGACGGDDGGGGSGVEPGEATFRVVYAASGTNAPVVDIWVDGVEPTADSKFDNLTFGNATPYMSLASGKHEIAVVADGATLTDTDKVFFTQEFDLADKTQTTVFSYGAGTASALSFGSYSEAILAEDGVPANAPSRVIHAASGIAAVDVLVDGTVSSVTNLAPGEVSDPVGLDVNTPYLVGIRAAGGSGSLADFDVAVPAAGRYAVFAAGSASEGVVLLAVTEAGVVLTLTPVEYTYVRVFHGANAGAVDVWASPTGGAVAAAPLAAGLERLAVAGGSSNGYFKVRVGQYDLAITAAGASSPADAVLEGSAVLDKGEYYTAFAYGDPSSTLNSGVGLISDNRGVASDVNVASASSNEDPITLYLDGAELNGGTGVSGGAVLEDNQVTPGLVRLGFSDPALRNPESQFTFSVESGVAELFVVGVEESGDYPFQAAYVKPSNEVVVLDADAQLRVLHISETNDASVDVYANGIRVADNLALYDGTPYISVPSGTTDIEVFEGSVTDIETATPSTSLVEQGLLAGERFTMSLFDTGGFTSSPTAELYEDPLQTDLPANIRVEDSGKCALRVVHNNGGNLAEKTIATYLITGGATNLLLVDDLTLGGAGYYETDESVLSTLSATTGLTFGTDVVGEGDDIDLNYQAIDTTGCESQLLSVHLGVKGPRNVLHLYFNDGTTQIIDFSL